MSVSVAEMAKNYYPKLWNDKRIAALVEAKKLTAEEAKAIREAASK